MERVELHIKGLEVITPTKHEDEVILWSLLMLSVMGKYFFRII